MGGREEQLPRNVAALTSSCMKDRHASLETSGLQHKSLAINACLHSSPQLLTWVMSSDLDYPTMHFMHVVDHFPPLVLPNS